MRQSIYNLEERAFWLFCLGCLVQWVIVGYLWDIARLAGFAYCSTPGADPQRSIGLQRVEYLIYEHTQRVGVGWRFTEGAWKGIRRLYTWHRETNRMGSELRRREAALRSALAEARLPGNNLDEQTESLRRLLKLAEAGRAALDDHEWAGYLAAKDEKRHT